MKQYEIWWAELPKPAGRRPVLLLSRDDAYAFLHKCLAAEITSTVRHIPIEVLLGSSEGMPKPCVVNCHNFANNFKASPGKENLQTLPKTTARAEAGHWRCLGLGRVDRVRRVVLSR